MGNTSAAIIGKLDLPGTQILIVLMHKMDRQMLKSNDTKQRVCPSKNPAGCVLPLDLQPGFCSVGVSLLKLRSLQDWLTTFLIILMTS